uniref:Uncharacterized protein n=1 Tax=Rhizophora mucronata TaxID=61149 RepID=A0A2P2Q766_RHIMU
MDSSTGKQSQYPF